MATSNTIQDSVLLAAAGRTCSPQVPHLALEARARQLADEVIGHLTQGRHGKFSEVSPDLIGGIPVMLIAEWQCPEGAAYCDIDSSESAERNPAELLAHPVTRTVRRFRARVRALDARSVNILHFRTANTSGQTLVHDLPKPAKLVMAASCNSSILSSLQTSTIPALVELGTMATRFAASADALRNNDLLTPLHELRRSRIIGIAGLTALVHLMAWVVQRTDGVIPTHMNAVGHALCEEELIAAAWRLAEIAETAVLDRTITDRSIEEVIAITCFVSGLRGIAEALMPSTSRAFSEPQLPKFMWVRDDPEHHLICQAATLIHELPELGRDLKVIDRAALDAAERNLVGRVPTRWLPLRWAVESGHLCTYWPAYDVRLKVLDCRRKADVQASAQSL